MSDQDEISRRSLLTKAGMLFTGIVTAALSVPIIQYVLSSVTRGNRGGYLAWIPARTRERVSRGRDAPCHVPQPVCHAE
jgi:hypothetical protein